MKKEKFKSYYDILKEENKKLKLKNEMLELILFNLIRKEIFKNEKS